MPASITRRIDPLANEDNLGQVLCHCASRRETKLVSQRAAYQTQKEIASSLGMSTGWTCEKLAEIRSRCGWENARRAKKMKQRRMGK